VKTDVACQPEHTHHNDNNRKKKFRNHSCWLKASPRFKAGALRFSGFNLNFLNIARLKFSRDYQSSLIKYIQLLCQYVFPMINWQKQEIV
jgi:hypothetical protein